MMTQPTIRTSLHLIGLCAVLAISIPATAIAGDTAGTYLVFVTVPPNPLLGNPVDIVVPETASFNRRGGYVAASSLPGLPIPSGDDLAPAVLSVGQGNWKRTGGGITTTNWRLLSDPDTGEFRGFAKIYAELQKAGPDAMVGEYVFELLNPDLTPMELSGEPVVVGPAPVELSKLPVEPLP